MDALPKFLFGGESFATQNATELKRGLVIDAILALLLLLGLAGAAFGQSQDAPKDQKQQGQQQQPSNQSASPATQAQPQSEDSVAEAARKAKQKKAKKVYSEEDLAGLKGGVSVVGDPNPQSHVQPSGNETAAVSAPAESGSGDGKPDEQAWRGRAGQIHADMDTIDEQIKALKEDIKKNGSSGFNAQRGLKDNVVYLDDKTARVQQLEGRKKKLEQTLDDLQEQGRKAGIPPEWVR